MGDLCSQSSFFSSTRRFHSSHNVAGSGISGRQLIQRIMWFGIFGFGREQTGSRQCVVCKQLHRAGLKSWTKGSLAALVFARPILPVQLVEAGALSRSPAIRSDQASPPKRAFPATDPALARPCFPLSKATTHKRSELGFSRRPYLVEQSANTDFRLESERDTRI